MHAPFSQPGGLHEVPKWTRRYAQSRALPFICFMIVFVIISMSLGALSHFAGAHYRAGHYFTATLLVAGATLFAIVIVAGSIFLAVPRWGGRWVDHAVREKLYRAEGHVAFAPPSYRQKRLGFIVAVVFALCNLAAVVLGINGYIPREYMQPVSALYVVPFLFFLYLLLRPQVHPLVLLWPLLYGLHALLIFAGVPILFSGSWEWLNMLIPIAGYGLLSGVIAHLYNRYALRRLKEAVSSHDH